MKANNSHIYFQTITLCSMESKKLENIPLETKEGPRDFAETYVNGHPARYACYPAPAIPFISL